jgi:hypothetical protein
MKVADLKKGAITGQSPNEEIKADCTIMIKDENFISLASILYLVVVVMCISIRLTDFLKSQK